MINKEKTYALIEKYRGLICFCMGLIGIIIGLTGLVLDTTLTWRSIGKMAIAVLFLVIIAISAFVTIKSAIFLIREPLNDEIKKLKSDFKEEKEDLQLELDEEKKQYDELVEQVELPKAVDKAITVEKNHDWGISSPYNDIIQNRKDDRFPYLQFYMRVINRTYYYFEPDKMVICCLFDNHKLCDEWNSKVKTKERTIEIDNLRKCNDGTIMVRFPIKEQYANLRKWKLDGTVTYKLKGSAIKANEQYMYPEIGIHIEYELPEEQITKLKEEVKKSVRRGTIKQ